MSDSSGRTEATEKPRESIGDIVRTVIYALLIALVFRTVLFQPFSIPSGSMKSTLLIGDYLFVSKYAYGYSKYSLPYGHLLPVSGRFFGAEPERGDVIVFKKPGEEEVDYIKRVVGLPGDRVQMREGVLFLNGAAVDMRRIEDFTEPRTQGRFASNQQCDRRRSTAEVCAKTRFIETLPNGVSHEILDGAISGGDNTKEFLVPAGSYFFVGDNRDNSQDSRLDLGMVPHENLVGRAEVILLSSSGAFWEVWKWRGDRFFHAID